MMMMKRLGCCSIDDGEDRVFWVEELVDGGMCVQGWGYGSGSVVYSRWMWMEMMLFSWSYLHGLCGGMLSATIKVKVHVVWCSEFCTFEVVVVGEKMEIGLLKVLQVSYEGYGWLQWVVKMGMNSGKCEVAEGGDGCYMVFTTISWEWRWNNGEVSFLEWMSSRKEKWKNNGGSKYCEDHKILFVKSHGVVCEWKQINLC